MAYGNKKLGGGQAASHNSVDGFPIHLAPATGAEKNVIREELTTVACWRIDDLRFDFNSAFVAPDSKDEFAELKVLRDAHPGCPISIFGHADPVGDEEYNKGLSGRRAEAIFAVLIRDAARWEKLYASDGWSLRHTQIMLQALGGTPGNTSGSVTAASTQAIKDFQSANGLNPDGAAGTQTRAKLFEKYMEFLHPQKFEKSEFLGKGSDANGKGDFQGCSEFNPSMVFSKSEQAAFDASADKTKRNEENSVNRRVLALFFRPGTQVPMDAWPCPRASEGTAGCQKRLWSDSAARRSNTDTRREFSTSQDTFGCRFYHRLALGSPCEAPPPPPAPVSLTLKGKLFWNRTWDYHDEKVPIAAIKEYLPSAQAELYLKPAGGALASHAKVFLTDDGEFVFTNVPKVAEAEIRVLLEHKDNKIVLMRGKSNARSDANFEVKTGQVIWHQFPIDAAPIQSAPPGPSEVNLGDVEIKLALFVDMCDCYKTIWFGHKRVLELASDDLPLCPVEYPEPNISNANGTRISIGELDLKDRAVILHEYGHFITGVKLNGLNHTGYDYNDDPGHGPGSKEHYEPAWIEGHATFLSCALTDDPHYHDGYDTTLNMHLDTDNTVIGPHNEASIQEALWHIHKVQKIDFKQGFWKALTDLSIRKPNTVFDFFDNWKDLGCPDIDKVIASFKKFNIEFGYKYNDGTGRFTRVAPPALIDVPKKQFQTTNELYNQFGTFGAGTEPDYNEEFYNRNKFFNAGSLAAGSTIASPKVSTGKAYIVPERFQIKK